MSLGDNMKHVRKLAGYTQKDMAAKLNVSPVSYGSYEQGKIKPTLDKLVLFSQLTQTSIDELLDNKVNPYERYKRLLGGKVDTLELENGRVQVTMGNDVSIYPFPVIMTKKEFVDLVEGALNNRERIVQDIYKTMLFLYASHTTEGGTRNVTME